MTDIIPDEVRQFLIKNIDSIAQWEAVLLMRVDPEKAWNAEIMAHSIYTTEQETARILEQLVARSIAVRDTQAPAYRYHPDSAELERVIKVTAELYRQYLIPIT